MIRALDGRAIAAAIRQEAATEVAALTSRGERAPGLTAILVGESPASRLYVSSKTRACAEVGILGRTVQLEAAVSAAELLRTIDRLNRDPGVDGILVQLPLPAQISVAEVQARVDPGKDVDGFHPENVGRLWLGEETFVPATPLGILELLRRERIELAGRHAVVVGRSNIVGKPMVGLLLAEHCTVTVCHSRTRDLAAVCRRADLLVAAVGQPALLGEDHVKEGAVVIDVGQNRVTCAAEVERLFPGDESRRRRLEKGGSVLVGDVDYTRVAPRSEAITPVPGGVGPLTVAMVIANTLKARRRHP